MTEQPDRLPADHPDQPRGSKPGETQEPLDDKVDNSAEEEFEDDDHDALQGIASLERLRDRVEVAAREMRRLRDENGALAERIQELESRPAVDPHGTFLSLDHDPDVLKRKISGYIDAIDRYMEKEQRP